MSYLKTKVSITIDSDVLSAVECLVDGIRIRNRSDAIECLLKRSVGYRRVAVILCGGDEKNHLFPDGILRFVANMTDHTVVEDQIMQLRLFGFSKIFIVGHNNILTAIFSVIKNGEALGVSVEYVEEKKSFGTGYSLKLLDGKVDDDFLVVYGDLVFRFDLNHLYREHILNGGVVTIALSSSSRPAEKGTVELNGNKILKFSQKVKSATSFIAFTPIFVASPKIFSYAGNSLEDDVFPKLVSDNGLYGLLLNGSEVHVHKKGDIKKAKEIILRENHQHMPS